MKVQIDMKQMTLGDMEDFEAYAGAPMSTMSQYRRKNDEGEDEAFGMPTKFMTALVWIGIRQTDPDFKVEDVRALPVGELDLEVTGEEDATPPNEDG